jgi:long-chain acyl-CoA synthetase
VRQKVDRSGHGPSIQFTLFAICMDSEIVDAFEQIRRDTPERPLVFLPTTDTILTAAGLWEAARSVGSALDEAGINRRGLIVAVLGNRPAYLATFLACRMRGQPLCPLDSGTAAAEIDAIAAQLGAAAVLTFASTPALLGIVIKRPDQDYGDSRHGDAALLKMTSGTSGAPRATITPESVLVSDSRTLMGAMRISRDDVQMAAIPLSHAYGIGNLVVPLFLNGSAIVLRDSFVPHRLPDDARRYAATAFPGVPFMFDHFAKNPPAEGWPPTLRNLLSAGAPLEAAVAQRFRDQFEVKIRPFYGTSETGGITYDATDNPAADGMVGTPLRGVQIELVAEEGAPEGGGRVLVRGPCVISRYADDIDPESFVHGGFLTGDLGVFDAAGQLTLCGRVSSFVNIAGRKVQPDEVERVLRLVESVVDVRVVGVKDERRGEQLVACLVARPPHPSVIELRQFCAARLASHKIPRAFVLVDEIPLTERGKTDRVRLRALVSDRLSSATGML